MRKVPLTGNQPAAQGSVSVRMRTGLWIILYRLAIEHASKAGEAHQMGSDGAEGELDHALQTIVLAAACLEAFINSWDGKEDDKSRLEDKWIEVTKRLSGGETFERGAQPFQKLKRLIRLRNYILHYKASFAPPVKTPVGNISEFRAKINHTSANQAVSSMRNMLIHFHELCNLPLPQWVT